MKEEFVKKRVSWQLVASLAIVVSLPLHAEEAASEQTNQVAPPRVKRVDTDALKRREKMRKLEEQLREFEAWQEKETRSEEKLADEATPDAPASQPTAPTMPTETATPTQDQEEKPWGGMHTGQKITDSFNPSTRPIVSDSADVFLLGEVLLMKPIQGGMEFAYRSDGNASAYVGIPTPPNTFLNTGSLLQGPSGPIRGTIRSVRGKWDWGFRLGAGYNMPYDGWDVTGTWVRFHSVDSKSNRPNNLGAKLVPLVQVPLSNQDGLSTGLVFVSQARSRWNLKIDLIDLELGREFNVSKVMTLRTFMGPRLAFIPQQLRLTFTGGTLVDSSLGTNFGIEPNSVAKTHLRNKFWGMGPRAGLNSIWGLGWGVSLYGKADMSLLWGSFHVKSRFDITPTARTGSLPSATPSATNVQTTVANIRNNHETLRATAGLGLGLRYDYNFRDEFALGVYAGYEHMIFWDQNQYMKFDYNRSFALNAANENLALAGFHLGVLFDF